MSLTKSHVPERTCIACRQIKPKRELIRLVRSIEGEVKPDYKGNEPGRGAYLCKKRECWELALEKDRKDRLARALKTSITPENREFLSSYGKELLTA